MTVAPSASGILAATRPRRILLFGNPNTGKTTLFNRLCGLRAKTANFPGTTTRARTAPANPTREPEGQVYT
jgi:ferrous iron transport protein B